jgi:hypothetical protein
VSRRLGDAERQALAALIECGGRWTAEDRPLWDNRYWTEQLLISLARKGFVMVMADRSYRAVTDSQHRTNL